MNPKTFWERIKSTKTLKLAIGGILVALGGWLSGNLGGTEAVAAAFLALQTIFLRDGIAKGER